MSEKSVKLAISLPKNIVAEIENLRDKLDISRSQVILEGVSMWLRKIQEDELDRKCARGYKKKPEDSAESNPLIMSGLASFSKDKW